MEAKEQGKVKELKKGIDQRVLGAGVIVALFVVAVAYLSFFPGTQPGSSTSATIQGKGGAGAGTTGTPVQVTSADEATQALTDASQTSAGIATSIDGILEDLTS
ncbi:MAG: hypothetical protein HY393_03365 [Candidatus Diapherotrites archaeon]|nr:hypothetical protein [Candidatus Diapherotrites archaeon]